MHTHTHRPKYPSERCIAAQYVSREGLETGRWRVGVPRRTMVMETKKHGDTPQDGVGVTVE